MNRIREAAARPKAVRTGVAAALVLATSALTLGAPVSGDQERRANDDWILFYSYRPDLQGGGVAQWELVRPDGTERTVLEDAAWAFWSADGRLVFEIQRAGDGQCVTLLRSLQPDGSVVGELELPAEDQAFLPSPDGERFLSLRLASGQGACNPPSAADYDVWVMDVDGSNQRLLADNGGDPSWSPDGRHVVLVEDGANTIVVRDLRGARRVLVESDTAIRLSSPRWSPDGSLIAYQAWGVNGWSLFLIRAEGGTPAALPAHDVAAEVTWAPDSSQLAVTVQRGTARVVTLVASDGTRVAQLTPEGFEDIEPSWSPDGTRLALVRIGRDDRALTVVTVADGRTTTLFDANSPMWRPRPAGALPDGAVVPDRALARWPELVGLTLLAIAAGMTAMRLARACPIGPTEPM